MTILLNTDMPCKEIAIIVGCTEWSVRKHARKLQAAGLLEDRRQVAAVRRGRQGVIRRYKQRVAEEKKAAEIERLSEDDLSEFLPEI